MIYCTDEQKNTTLGVIAVLIWSFAALIALGLTDIPPFELLFIEFSIAFGFVMLRSYFSSDKKNFFNFSKWDLAVASLALVVNQVCYNSAFRNAPAIEVDLINYLWPTLLVLFLGFLPKEKFCLSYFLACIVCVGGIYYLLSPDYSKGISVECVNGYLYAFGAALSWTLYSLYTRYRSNNSPNCISCACGVAALVSFVVHIKYEKFVTPSTLEASLLILTGVFQLGLAYYFWDRALKKGCAKFMGLASYAIPVLSVMILVVFGFADFEQRMIIATAAVSLAPLIPFCKSKWSQFAKNNAPLSPIATPNRG